VITIHLTSNDLLKLRFAYRPILELAFSYRVLINREFQGLYGDWVDEAERALYGVELPYLHALVMPHLYIPDFLTPIPTSNRRDLRDDLEYLLATPEALIRENVQTLIEIDGESEIRCFFISNPREAIQYLIDDMLTYWKRTLDDYWKRMTSVLETDVLYRGRMLAIDGPGALFPDLHPSIDIEQTDLKLAPVCMHTGHELNFSLTGYGLQLVPTIFKGCGRTFQIEDDHPSMITYPVRGTGLWHRKPDNPGHSLELALGAGRARVLEALVTPTSTGELAIKLQITAGTASQHLGRLTQAGLVEPRRSGKRVYYHLTERGEKLIALFEPVG
jgi:hypothetical protein